MKIPNACRRVRCSLLSLARIVSEDSQLEGWSEAEFHKSSKDS
mgnify:CR=1 FL=1